MIACIQRFALLALFIAARRDAYIIPHRSHLSVTSQQPYFWTKMESASKIYDGEQQEFTLKKKMWPPGCTGMFWRPDPTGAAKLERKDRDWPRDGAVLRGKVVSVKGEQWLLATHVKQIDGDWIEAPPGAAMPFEYAQYYLE